MLSIGLVSAARIGIAFASATLFAPLAAGTPTVTASLAGLLGHMCLTAIKRDHGVRDWGHLIPGQGGFLDQLGPVNFGPPIFYQLVQLSVN